MITPFVVFSLPRSRSAWLARWLSASSGLPVGHDIAIEADSIDVMLELLWRRVRGTCETGAVEAWPILLRAMPHARIVVVLRPLDYVAASLAAVGITPDVEALAARDAALHELAGQPGVLTVRWTELADPVVCERLHEHCLAAPFVWPVWRDLHKCDVQIDIARRRARLEARAEPIAALKAEVAARLAAPAPWVTVGEEPWCTIAGEYQDLARAHHVEATAGWEGTWRLNHEIVGRMDAAGLWRVFIARVDSRMVGYCCWSREVNAEADAPLTMEHGPFFVSPEYAGLQLGRRLIDASRAQFAGEGVKMLRLHHTTHGRGIRAGALYARMGAHEFRRDWLLRLGDG